ncbi:MAG TPA: hypothetical protein VLM38_05745 [Blastocatellia bacterium]|nr:hypothetical protein [Blastocatellia bacterium]
MSSEAIVVSILTALAIAFIIWVRMNSRDHERGGRANDLREEGESPSDRK